MLVLATSVWVGLVAIFMGRSSGWRSSRGLGHAYGLCGGVAQARRMTRLRQDALRDPGRPGLAGRVRRGARNAAALRAVIAALSLALRVLGAVIAT